MICAFVLIRWSTSISSTVLPLTVLAAASLRCGATRRSTTRDTMRLAVLVDPLFSTPSPHHHWTWRALPNMTSACKTDPESLHQLPCGGEHASSVVCVALSRSKNVFNELRNSDSHVPHARYFITFLFWNFLSVVRPICAVFMAAAVFVRLNADPKPRIQPEVELKVHRSQACDQKHTIWPLR